MKNRLIPIAVIIGILAVAAVVIILVTRQGGTTTTGSNNQTTREDTAASAQQVPPGMQPATQDYKGPDTVVPEGTTPEEYVKKYYDSILKKDYQTAYDMQAGPKKATTNVDGFKQTQESYGIQSFTVGGAQAQDEKTIVEAKLVLQEYGTWTSIWTFAKKDGQTIVESAKTGMQ